MIDMIAVLKEIHVILEGDSLRWEGVQHASAGAAPPMSQFTGRADGWVFQVVSLDNGLRMGTASNGSTVMKLTDDLCELAEKTARRWLAGREPYPPEWA